MIAALLLAVQTPTFDFDYRPGAGLNISAAAVPLVRGSWMQYYAPGWTKGFFSTYGGNEQVTRVDADTLRQTFEGGGAKGSITFRRQGQELTADYRFEWNREETALVETTAGMVWAPAFENGSLLADGKATRALDRFAYDQPGILQRRFSPDASKYRLSSPVADIVVTASRPLTIFDARGGYDQAWAEGRQLWWLGAMEVPVSRERPAEMRVTWRIEPKSLGKGESTTARLAPATLRNARLPDESLPLLIPKPNTNQLDFAKPVELSGNYRFPAGRARFMENFTQALARRFVVGTAAKGRPALAVDAGVSKLGFRPGGYRITITPKTVTVLGEEEEGLRNGWQRLAQIVFAKGGRLWLPTGTLMDQPNVAWRGVHLFVGPDARGFQRRLWENVLLPLGFNHVVLQCEQTEWLSAPNVRGGITMKRDDLVRLFEMYRAMGIDPIPLIQSWGHAEWFFRNGGNLDLAFNREIPYAIDPRKPEARAKIAAIWDEAIALLKPKTIHFGLDEVNMRGGPEDEDLLSRMWESYLPQLTALAERHKVAMMLWGDKMLAPGEAPDAALAPDKAHAARRRGALKKGTWIADWHYKADPKPQTFTPVLQLWKREGMRPVASGWYRPENVQGFATAADWESVPYLQTTWAGYESNERNMVTNLTQFGAMVLAAEVCWSGEKPAYDPNEVFRRMYFAVPSPLTPSDGTSLGSGREGRIGGTGFRLGPNPLALQSVLSTENARLPASVTVPVGRSAGALVLALDAIQAGDDGEDVAEVEVRLKSGQFVRKRLRYGYDLRAKTDPAANRISPRADGLSAVRIEVGGLVEAFTLKALNPYSGVRLHGATLL